MQILFYPFNEESTMKKSFIPIFALSVLCFLTACAGLFSSSVPVASFTTEVSSLEPGTFTTKYGNLYTAASVQDFTAAGFEWGDLVTVTFLDKKLSLPVVPTYSYVDTGVAAIIVNKDENGKPSGTVSLAINMGDFTTTNGIATKITNADKTWYWVAEEGVEFPLPVTFVMEEEAGYYGEYLIHDLTRTNYRADYPQLSDEEFANFRKVAAGNVHNLYRTSNPVNSELGRNTFADLALRKAGVTVVMNLSDDKATAQGRREYRNTYYSTLKVIYLNLGVDFESEDFKKGLAEGLRFFAKNPGIYAVHCTEGKDRAGFVSALLECLMGATPEQVIEDYMITYYNYYGVQPHSEQYNVIANSNIVKTLEKAFNLNFSKATPAALAEGAEKYMKSIGLTSAEIAALKANL